MTSIYMRRPHLRDFPPIAPLPDGYLLRQAFSPGDDAALAAMLTAAFGDVWDEGHVRARLTDTPDVRVVYVVVQGGEIVATASHRRRPVRWPSAGFVHWVGTHPEHTRRGLASVLLVRLLREFATGGDDAAMLE